MKKYEPESLVNISRYQKYFPTLPEKIQQDIYRQMERLIEEEKE